MIRSVIAVNRRRPVMWLPSVAVAVLLAAVLAVHWRLVPPPGGAVPRSSTVGDVTAQRPAAVPAGPSANTANTPAPISPKSPLKSPSGWFRLPTSSLLTANP